MLLAVENMLPHLPKLTSLYDLGELKAGNLEAKIADSPEDIDAAQALRYRVFVEEMGAKPTAECLRAKRDFDDFDEYCDHLLVVEHQDDRSVKVVGTYRMLRRSSMQRIGRFYSESEYDITPILAYPGEVMEVGRSCVDVAYRNRAVMQLLWRGIGAYVTHFNVPVLFGCASFPGIDPAQHAVALSYLHHYHLAPDNLRPRALKERYVEMKFLPKEAVDVKDAVRAMPALIKGYLRLNGYVGIGAVVDREYNTTDVSIVVKIDRVTDKYAARYGKDMVAGGHF